MMIRTIFATMILISTLIVIFTLSNNLRLATFPFRAYLLSHHSAISALRLQLINTGNYNVRL